MIETKFTKKEGFPEETVEEERIDPGHRRPQTVLRVVGPVVFGIGVLLTVIAIASFGVAIVSGRPPVLFVLAFFGLPLVFAGTIMTFVGYMGKIARYTQAETAPVAKDTFNYLAGGTQEGAKTVAAAIGEGIGAGIGAAGGAKTCATRETTKVRCHKCNFMETPDAKFCSACGAALEKDKLCPTCNELNDADAKFCDNCGHGF